jgi:hypothetical protein
MMQINVSQWIAVWIKIISQPNERAFIEVGESPAAQPKTAYLWIFLAGFLFITCVGVSYMLSSAEINFGAQKLVMLLGAALFIGGALVISFASSVAIKQWIAKLCGGTGEYPKLAYLFGAIYAPFALISSASVLLGAIPSMRIVSGGIISLAFLYALYLQILAVKAVNRFGWKEAALSVLIPFAAVLSFCGFIIPAGLAAMEQVLGVFGKSS